MNMTRAMDQYLFGLIPKVDFELTDSMREFGLTVDTLYATTPKGRQRLAKIARSGDRIVALGGVEFTTLGSVDIHRSAIIVAAMFQVAS